MGWKISCVLTVLSMAMMTACVFLPWACSSAGDTSGKASWQPANRDWANYRNNAQRTGVSEATGAMKFAYYSWGAKLSSGNSSTPLTSSAVVADIIPGNSNSEIIFGSQDSRVYCLDGRNGAVRWRYQTSGTIYFSSASISDINADGNPEVVICSCDGRVYALKGETGGELWKYATRGSITASPAVADVNGDGKQEVFVVSEDGYAYALRSNGTLLWKFSLSGSGAAWEAMASPAIADIDGDGQLEVVAVGSDGFIHALEGLTGKEEWTLDAGYKYLWPVVIFDIDKDTVMEILYVRMGNESLQLEYASGKTGTVEWTCSDSRWYQQDGDGRFAPLCVADGNRDGINEIYFQTNKMLCCISITDGTSVWVKNFSTEGFVRSSLGMSICDINGDGRLEVLIGFDKFVVAVYADNGWQVWRYASPSPIMTDIVPADGDGDGEAEVYFGCQNGRAICIDYNL